MVNMVIFAGVMAVFVAVTLFLGWYGYKNTKNQDQFMLGRNKSNPLLIGLAYGASFLSVSAIVGFGGVAAGYGMGMMWLVFLNLFVGLFIAFVVFGKRTRRLNVNLGALTFADFLGKRFNSSFIRTLTAVIVLVGMPIYCAAVLIAGVSFLSNSGLGLNRDIAIFLLSFVVLLYVAYGGIIAVMYNDALQAAIMFIGMFTILLVTYFVLGQSHDGGISGIHQGLTDLWASAGAAYPSGGSWQGMTGWASFPSLGSNAWLYMVSTVLMGVGIGALAQPQLVARFMTAKDTKTLNRSLIVGSIFMIVIVGSAYTVGALTNLYYGESPIHSLSQAIDTVIPLFVTDIFGTMGAWGELFFVVFILAILCAAISTMCVLLHTMGAAAGYDLWSEAGKKFKKVDRNKPSLRITRIATVIMMVVVIFIAYMLPLDIIARATAIFMGLTAAALLPAYTHAVFSKNPRTRPARLSMVAGSVVWLVWALFVNASIGGRLGIEPVIAGQLIYVDPLIIALPVSAAIMIIGCFTGPREEKPRSLPASSPDTTEHSMVSDGPSQVGTAWPADLRGSPPSSEPKVNFSNKWPEHLMRL
ncbi:MAG: sodium:solute symporter family protein [Methanomassiliicoccaceae archaeon]|nr:sodium:solute symporter family protein [Methanomassiliicoccaceae archaeon]